MSLPAALGVVDKLMSGIPHSAFPQVAKGYRLVWHAALGARIMDWALWNLFIVAMAGLEQLIAVRYNNMHMHKSTSWNLMAAFEDPDTELVVILAKTLMTSSNKAQVQEKLSDKCLTGHRCLSGQDISSELSIFTHKHDDYVVILDFADSTIRFTRKSLFTVQVIGPARQKSIAVKGLLPRAPHMRIRPSLPAEEVRIWWETNIGGKYC